MSIRSRIDSPPSIPEEFVEKPGKSASKNILPRSVRVNPTVAKEKENWKIEIKYNVVIRVSAESKKKKN